MVAQAMSRADLVIIPTKGSELDAIEAIKVIKFIGRQERAYNKNDPFRRYYLLQTNPAVRPRTLKSLELDMINQNIPIFDTALPRARCVSRDFLFRRRSLGTRYQRS